MKDRNTKIKHIITRETAKTIIKLYYDCHSIGRIANELILSQIAIKDFMNECFSEDVHLERTSMSEALEKINRDYKVKKPG